MRIALAWPLAALFAGCATPPDPEFEAAAARENPGTLAGVPAAVVAERALFDLDSGDPRRAEQARCVLLALPEGPGLDALRARVRQGAAGSSARLDALAVLAERGDPLEAAAAEEVVAMCLREMARPEPSRRARMLAMDRLRGMGEPVRPLLREAARPGRPSAAEAAEALEALFGEASAQRLQGLHP